MGAGDDLIALYWTTSGPVEVHFGREWSLFDLRERCEQAARVGFRGIGIWHADLEHMLETRTLPELRQIVDEYGLDQLELEFLGDWFLDPDDERRRASDERRALLFAAAAELPVHHIKVGNIVGTECELAQIVERYAELCADAAQYTDAKIVYEFMPYDVQVNDVDTALAVVEGADAPNGGLAFDTWHLGKMRLEPEDLRRFPSRFVSWVELSRRPVRVRGGPPRRGDQPPPAARRRRVPHRRVRVGMPRARVRRPLGGRGALRGAAEPSHRADLRPSLRDDERAARRRHEKGASVSENGLSKERLVWMHTQMVRVREFEERVKRTFEEHPGVIRGHTHLADGAEASIVGSIAALRPDDQLLTTYRCHGYPIALGTDTKALMAEIYGKETGICKGYGGSMHLTDVGRGFLGTSGIVGQGIPHAAGAAWAAQIRGKGQVVLSFFGDGATKQGAFHETLNIASLWKLPIVFVMENNNYHVYTKVEQEDANAAAGEPLAVKAQAYSMPGMTIDGGDPVEVYEQMSAAVERARSGDGPTLIESRSTG